MKEQERTSLIAHAQALRNAGMSALNTAREIGVSASWVNRHTNSINTKYVSTNRGEQIRPERREYVIKRCVTFFAFALSRARERRMNECS